MSGNVLETLSINPKPRLFATVADQKHSRVVLQQVRLLENRPIVQIFGSATEAANADLRNAVVFFDGSVSRQFRPVCVGATGAQVPEWAKRSRWGVVVGSECDRSNRHAHCARYTTAIFFREFSEEMGAGILPWGPKRQPGKRSRLSGGYHSLKRVYALRV